jgi:hypothetical protein
LQQNGESEEDKGKISEGKNISASLKKKTLLKEKDLSTILLNLINRKRFEYTASDTFFYIIRCLCCRNLKKKRQVEDIKKHYMFEKCEEKLN